MQRKKRWAHVACAHVCACVCARACVCVPRGRLPDTYLVNIGVVLLAGVHVARIRFKVAPKLCYQIERRAE